MNRVKKYSPGGQNILRDSPNEGRIPLKVSDDLRWRWRGGRGGQHSGVGGGRTLPLPPGGRRRNSAPAASGQAASSGTPTYDITSSLYYNFAVAREKCEILTKVQ
jgi:hypothetical protein